MSTPKRTPGNVAKPKGQAMAPEVPEVLPPDGWVKDSPFGFLRYEGGDLARLGDVQAWLEEVKGFDCSQSMAELIKRMPEDVMGCLYFIYPPGDNGKPLNAQLMPPDSTFSHGGGALPKPVWKSEERHARTLAMFHASRAEPPKKTGRAALVDRLEYAVRVQQMGRDDPMNNPESHAARLAVPMAKAYQWWGYGQQAAPAGADTETGGEPDVSTWAKVVAVYRDRPGVWTDEMCKTAAREEKRRKDRHEAGVRIAMGAELVNPDPEKDGLTAKTIGGVVARGNKLIADEQATAEAAKAEAEKNRTLENRRNSGGF